MNQSDGQTQNDLTEINFSSQNCEDVLNQMIVDFVTITNIIKQIRSDKTCSEKQLKDLVADSKWNKLSLSENDESQKIRSLCCYGHQNEKVAIKDFVCLCLTPVGGSGEMATRFAAPPTLEICSRT